MTTELRATPARVALLQSVNADHIHYDVIDGSYINLDTGRVVSTPVRALIAAGWVARRGGDLELTAAGRTILDNATSKENQ